MDFPVAFGNYQLLERIATGGMAELFLARSVGVEGFEKRLVIKRILPGLSRSPRFVAMFIHEAKISAMLSHPNIVQIYDLNQVGDDYYIAMEYIHGRDLARTLRRLRARGQRLPMGLAVAIAASAARGLAYAHSRTDAEGRPLHVVHRDVSPHNILLSFQGEVKLVDFGIARLEGAVRPDEAAEPREEGIGPGAGKYAYMSPEQAAGLALDRRSDVFSCAVVLYELLTNRRLFQSPDPAEKLRRVREAALPDLREHLPELPDTLEGVLRRALTRRPEDRTASADLFEEELCAFLYERGEPPDPGALGALVRELFSDELGEDPCVAVLRGLAQDLGRLDEPVTPSAAPPELPPDDPTVEQAAPPSPQGGRRGAVVLVAELLGLTDASDALDPDALLRTERALGQALTGVVQRYGGTVADLGHDALWAVFGAPQAHEDDPDRALACAAHLQRLSDRQGERLGQGGRPVRLAIGVHRGEVTLSAEEGGRCLPRGTAFKLARRLAGAVEPGDVAVSMELARSLAPRWRFQPGPALHRGEDRVMLLRGRQRQERGGHGRRWVRRGEELEVLSAALGELAEGRGGLVTLTGEAGMGKTRLTQELVERAERAGLPTLSTRAAPYGGAVPLGALRDLVASACGLEDSDGAERVRERLGRLGERGLDRADLTALAALFDAAPGAQVSENDRRQAFLRLVRGLAEEHPLLVVVEDAPNMGRGERALLAYLIEHTPDQRVLWLVTAREPALPWLPDPRHTVALTPPELEGRLALVTDVLGVRSVSAGLFTFIEQNAERSPLYMVELLTALEEHGLLRRQQGRAWLTEPTAPLVLPPGLEAIIAARIDALAPAQQAALRLAAVIGFGFTEPLLARALGTPDAAGALVALADAGLVAPEGQAGRWSFASQLVWEVARRPLTGEALREHHRAVAEAMTRLYGQRPGPYAQALAEHWAAAGRDPEAVTWMERAGDELRRGAFLERALECYRRGVSWALDLSQAPEAVRLSAEASLRLKAGEVAHLLGESVEASHHLQLALDIAGDLALTELECGCALALGRLYADQGDWTRAQATLEHGLDESRRCGLHELQVELLEALAQIASARHDWDRAEAALREALALAGEDQGLRALAWMGLGQRAMAAQHMPEAVECLQAARSAAAAAGDRLLLGRAVNLLGIALHAQAQYQEALASFREALELRRGTGLRAGVAVNLHNIGEALLRLGEPGRAWSALEQSREEAQAAGLGRVVVMNDLYLGYLAALRGDADGAQQLRQARAQAQALGDAQTALTGVWLEARLEAHAGRAQAAVALLRPALAQAQEQGASWIARDIEEELARLVGPPASST